MNAEEKQIAEKCPFLDFCYTAFSDIISARKIRASGEYFLFFSSLAQINWDVRIMVIQLFSESPFIFVGKTEKSKISILSG